MNDHKRVASLEIHKSASPMKTRAVGVDGAIHSFNTNEHQTEASVDVANQHDDIASCRDTDEDGRDVSESSPDFSLTAESTDSAVSLNSNDSIEGNDEEDAVAMSDERECFRFGTL